MLLKLFLYKIIVFFQENTIKIHLSKMFKYAVQNDHQLSKILVKTFNFKVINENFDLASNKEKFN